jgi:hypothetical protein
LMILHRFVFSHLWLHIRLFIVRIFAAMRFLICQQFSAISKMLEPKGIANDHDATVEKKKHHGKMANKGG